MFHLEETDKKESGTGKMGCLHCGTACMGPPYSQKTWVSSLFVLKVNLLSAPLVSQTFLDEVSKYTVS